MFVTQSNSSNNKLERFAKTNLKEQSRNMTDWNNPNASRRQYELVRAGDRLPKEITDVPTQCGNPKIDVTKHVYWYRANEQSACEPGLEDSKGAMYFPLPIEAQTALFARRMDEKDPPEWEDEEQKIPYIPVSVVTASQCVDLETATAVVTAGKKRAREQEPQPRPQEPELKKVKQDEVKDKEKRKPRDGAPQINKTPVEQVAANPKRKHRSSEASEAAAEKTGEDLPTPRIHSKQEHGAGGKKQHSHHQEKRAKQTGMTPPNVPADRREPALVPKVPGAVSEQPPTEEPRAKQQTNATEKVPEATSVCQGRGAEVTSIVKSEGAGGTTSNRTVTSQGRTSTVEWVPALTPLTRILVEWAKNRQVEVAQAVDKGRFPSEQELVAAQDPPPDQYFNFLLAMGIVEPLEKHNTPTPEDFQARGVPVYASCLRSWAELYRNKKAVPEHPLPAGVTIFPIDSYLEMAIKTCKEINGATDDMGLLPQFETADQLQRYATDTLGCSGVAAEVDKFVAHYIHV